MHLPKPRTIPFSQSKRNWLASLLAHTVIWFAFLGVSLALLYSSDDAWYRLARERFLQTFFILQLELLPAYLAIGSLFWLWIWGLKELSSSVSRPRRWLWPLGLFWFWLSMLLISLWTYFSSWFVPLSMIKKNYGIDISFGTIAPFRYLIYANTVLFLLVSGFAFWRVLRKLRARQWLFVGMAASLILGISFWPKAKRVQSTATAKNLPNIVIVGSDSMRADRVGAYGYERPTTPHIDAIAQQSAVLERVYAVAPSTSESLLSFLTGRIPQETGIRSIFPEYREAEAVKKIPHLPEVLRQAGYRTVVTGDWSASDFEWLMTGFDETDVEKNMSFVDYLDGAARRCHIPLLAFFANPAFARAAPGITGVLQSKHSPDSVLDKAEREIQIASQTGQPLFLFVFLSTTHMPYVVPENQPIRFGDPKYHGPHHRQLNFGLLDELLHSDLSEKLKGDADRIKDLYDSTVWIFDRQVERVDQALKKSKLSDNTIFVVLSDHGEDQWDPGTGLSRSIHAGNQSIQIPLLIRWPKHIQAMRIPQLLRETDLAPTLAELAGVKWEGGGLSFKKHLAGEPVADDREAFIEAGVSWSGPVLYPESGVHLSYPGITELTVPDLTWKTQLVIPQETMRKVMLAKDRALIRGNQKIIYRANKSGPMIYQCDLSADPNCERHLLPDPKMAEALRAGIARDPEANYLAWPKTNFEAAFQAILKSPQAEQVSSTFPKL